jgi:hypothetical protein
MPAFEKKNEKRKFFLAQNENSLALPLEMIHCFVD